MALNGTHVSGDQASGISCQDVIDRLPACIYVLDQDGAFMYANDAFYRLVGRAEGSLLGCPFTQVIHPEDAKALGRQINERRRRDRATKNLEVRFLRGEGTDRLADQRIRYVRLHAEGLHSRGQFIGTCGVVRDVTDERQRWQDLADSEERHRRLTEAAPATIAVEQNGRIAYVNTAGVALVGATDPKALIGQELLSVIAPPHRAVISELLGRPPCDEEPRWAKVQLHRLDGRVVEVEYIYRDIQYQGGPAAEILVLDVTERRRAEREREVLQRLSQRLTRSIAPGELGATLAAEARDLFGFDAFLVALRDPQSGVWKSVYGMDTAAGEDAPAQILPTTDGHAEWPMVDVPTLINRGDGEPENSGLVPLGHVERRSRSLMFAPIRWDGETIGVVTVQSYTDHRYAERDLSLLQTLADHCGGCLARLQAEQELLSQQVRNIRLDRLRWLGEMATDIAHVLNQPLQGVRGLAEHLLMGMDRGWEVTGEKVREKLGIIMAQADRMDYFIQHLRDLAQDSGRSVRYLTAPNQVLKAAAELFTSRGIRVHLHLATDLPSIHVNPRALEEAVVHLLSNAREATEERYGTRTRSEQTQITLRSSSMEVDGAAWVLIEVVDQGTGIPADLQVRIFEPFFTTKIPGHGTGLGLSVVKVIAEEYGGHVGVESEAGLGTTVRISLPASRR